MNRVTFESVTGILTFDCESLMPVTDQVAHHHAMALMHRMGYPVTDGEVKIISIEHGNK